MNDARGTFSIDLRLVQCQNCAAPLSAPVGGGEVRCEFCGTVARLAARPELRVSAQAGPGQAGADERQRLFALHQQALAYDPSSSPYSYYFPPPDLQYLGVLAQKLDYASDELLAQALPAFNAAVVACRASPQDPVAQRNCFWLVLLMAQIWAARREYLRQRAALETANELMLDSGRRYMIEASIAGAARNMGDLDSAEAWLGKLDPRPWNLDLDSTYRMKAASVALSRGQPDRALLLLGRSAAEVPFEPSSVAVSRVTRAAALEMAGEGAAAEAELQDLAKSYGRQIVDSILQKNTAVTAAAAAWARLGQRGAIPRGRGPRARRQRSPLARVLVGAGLPVVLVPLGLLFSPLLGAAMGSCMGYHEPVMRRLESCPAAVEALGTDIRPATVGLSCGNAETSGGTGNASWSLPVRGSRARGEYRFVAIRQGGPWQIVNAALEVDGRLIDVASCPAAMPPPPQPFGQPGMPGPGQPSAVGPATPAPGQVGACGRMAACCAVAGTNPHLSGLCGSLPQVQATAVGEQVCGQYLRSAAQVLQARGEPLPPACQ